MSLALVFPGQGAQRPHMLGDLPESPTIAAVVAESRALCHELGLPADLDSPAALRDTVATQLSLLIAGTACAKGLIDDFGLVPQFVAGHSVGAFAAAAVANVLTLREALIAVHLRGESMRAACAGRDWAMAAVTGLPTRTAQQLAERTSTAEEPVWVANINTATQTVLGGTATALAAAHEAARLAGATAFDRLDVAVASHGPVQDATARTLHAHLSTLPLRDATMRYITNVRGRSVGTAEAVVDDLADSVAHPVRWYDGVRLMAELGVTCTVETPPGHTLSRLIGAATPSVAALAVSDGLLTTVARARSRS